MLEPLVIFDCDGVLVDSERIANRVLGEMVTEAGAPTSTADSMRLYMGRSTQACMAMIEERLGRPLESDFRKRFRERVFDGFQRELTPVPGIADAIEAIPHTRCVASSSEADWIELVLRLTGLLEHFEGRLFSASVVGRGKPAPDIFHHAAAEMGFGAERCLVVEDSVMGARAGAAAGMHVLGFARDTDAAALRAEGAHVFREMAELPGLVREWAERTLG